MQAAQVPVPTSGHSWSSFCQPHRASGVCFSITTTVPPSHQAQHLWSPTPSLLLASFSFPPEPAPTPNTPGYTSSVPYVTSPCHTTFSHCSFLSLKVLKCTIFVVMFLNRLTLLHFQLSRTTHHIRKASTSKPQLSLTVSNVDPLVQGKTTFWIFVTSPLWAPCFSPWPSPHPIPHSVRVSVCNQSDHPRSKSADITTA